MTAMLSPAHVFWTLLVLCAIGFGLLYAVVHDAGRGARQRALRRRIAALGAPIDEAAIEGLRAAMARARQALRHSPQRASRGTGAPMPWFLFLGDGAADLPGLFTAAHAACPAPTPADDDDNAFWRWWLGDAMVAIEVHPDAVGEGTALPRTRELWLQALLALAERRDRLPLNGLAVCFSASSLLRADAADTPDVPDVPATAARMRRLLDEAGDMLRLQLPVYLIVTGLESLPGHATLRGALPPEVLAQVVGHRLADPFANGPAGDRLDAVFGPLLLQLHALRMALLREQPGASGQLAIHAFVEAVQALQPALREVARALFDSNARGSRAPRWRGLYLTASASDAAGGAFVHDLFEHFLPADQPLVRPGRPSSNAALPPS